MISFSPASAVEQAAVKQATENPKPYESWRASSLGKCPREHFYKRLGIKPTTPSDGNGLLRMGVGTKVHELAQGLLKDYLPEDVSSVETELEMYDKDLDLGGRLDFLVTVGDETEIIDLKTQQERAFWWMEKKSQGYTKKDGTKVLPKPVAEQKKEHVRQLTAYMLLRKRMGLPVTRGKLWYWSMDTSVQSVYSFFLTDELEHAVLDELAMLNKHWKAKTLPPCFCPQLWDGNGVGYCDYGGEEKDDKGKSLTCCDESLAKKLTKENDGN